MQFHMNDDGSVEMVSEGCTAGHLHLLPEEFLQDLTVTLPPSSEPGAEDDDDRPLTEVEQLLLEKVNDGTIPVEGDPMDDDDDPRGTSFCTREAGHPGKHMDWWGNYWSDEDEEAV